MLSCVPVTNTDRHTHTKVKIVRVKIDMHESTHYQLTLTSAFGSGWCDE